MITMNELVDLRMQQHIAHEIYRQQIMQRIPGEWGFISICTYFLYPYLHRTFPMPSAVDCAVNISIKIRLLKLLN